MGAQPTNICFQNQFEDYCILISQCPIYHTNICIQKLAIETSFHKSAYQMIFSI